MRAGGRRSGSSPVGRTPSCLSAVCEPGIDRPDLHGSAVGGWLDWDPEYDIDNWYGDDFQTLDGVDIQDYGSNQAC